MSTTPTLVNRASSSDGDLTPRATSYSSLPSLNRLMFYSDNNGAEMASTASLQEGSSLSSDTDEPMFIDDDVTPPRTPILGTQPLRYLQRSIDGHGRTNSGFKTYGTLASSESSMDLSMDSGATGGTLPNTDLCSFSSLEELQSCMENNEDEEMTDNGCFSDTFLTADYDNMETCSGDSLLEIMAQYHGYSNSASFGVVENTSTTASNMDVPTRTMRRNPNQKSRHALPKMLPDIEEECVDFELELLLSKPPPRMQRNTMEENMKLDQIFLALEISESLRETMGQTGPDPNVVALMKSSDAPSTFMDSLSAGIREANEEAIKLLETPRSSSPPCFSPATDFVSMANNVRNRLALSYVGSSHTMMPPTSFEYLSVPAHIPVPARTPRKAKKSSKSKKSKRQTQVVVPGNITGRR